MAGYNYGKPWNRHTDWHSSVSGLGDDAATASSLHASAIAQFAASGATAGVVTVSPSGQYTVIPQDPSAVSAYYDSVVEQANQGAYVYVAMFDKTNSNTPDGMVDETFTGVGIASTIQNIVFSPWIIVIGAAALFGVVYYSDKKKRRARRRRRR